MKLLICVSGSVAAIKVPELLSHVRDRAAQKQTDIEVKVVATANSQHFLDLKQLDADCIHTDADEWTSWKTRGDPVLHIELRKWADLIVVCPLSANTLAKVASGICDNLVTCVLRAIEIRAIDGKSTCSPTVLTCPAMNTMMWTHPITRQHLDTLSLWGYQHMAPIEKTLMCGDVGVGAMASTDDICSRIFELIK